ncbi:MAG: translation initiation factor [Bacteroidia bacterium]|nr:translation initiation factor [Bacteroidia bacterium]
MAKKKRNTDGIIYSTNPEYLYEESDNPEENTSTDPGKQDLRVSRQRLKGNKVVTLITGFRGSESDMKELGKKLKNICGCGGSVKDGEIMLQGDFKEKVGTELQKMKYRFKFSGG